MNMTDAHISKGNILIVDDTPENLRVLSKTLTDEGYEVRGVINGIMALRVAMSAPPELILLDIRMPEMDGYQVCKQLKANEKTRDIPIIFLSAMDDALDKMKAFSVGGVDYITKPFHQEEVLARIEVHLKLSNLTKTLEKQNVHLKEQEATLRTLTWGLEKRVEEQTQKLKEALKTADAARVVADAANTAKGQFLANISHELRTPLNAIIGYSEILMEETENLAEKEVFLADLEKIHGAGKHLLGTIDEILELCNVEANAMELRLETFEVATIVEEMSNKIRPLVEQNSNTLNVKCPENIGTIHADPIKVSQILFNLLSNAGKFTERGTITLTVKLITNREIDWISFQVSDTGIGMTSEQLEKVFESFSQGDNSSTRKYGGTGLGLFLCNKFCRMMGGNITVESVLGHGSIFTIQLPTQVK